MNKGADVGTLGGFPCVSVTPLCGIAKKKGESPIWEEACHCLLCGTLWGLHLLWGQGLLHFIQLLEVLPYQTGFTLGELVSLVKVFRLFKLEQMFFWCSECGHNR